MILPLSDLAANPIEFTNNSAVVPVDLGSLSTVMRPLVEELAHHFYQLGADVALSPCASYFTEFACDSIDVWRNLMTAANTELHTPDRVARLPEARKIVGDLTGKKAIPFYVNKLRINAPQIQNSRYSWHQDYATWPELTEQRPQIREQIIATLWFPLCECEKGNGLLLHQTRSAEAMKHHFVDGQGYFSASIDEPDLSDVTAVRGPAYQGALFGQTVMHRSESGSDKARISIDLRFVLK